MPNEIQQALAAIWATLAVSAVGTVIDARLNQVTHAQMTGTLLAYGLFCIIPYKISHRSDWARYVYAALCGMSLIILLSGWPHLSKPDIVSSVLQLPLLVFALYRLFTKPGSHWFLNRARPAVSDRPG